MRLPPLVAAAILAAAPAARADLPHYVAKADAAFAWKLNGKTDSALGTTYDLSLTSQVWEKITWEHGLQVYVPNGVKPTDTMFLWNQGGKPGTNSALFGMTLATKIKAPVAFLFGIPNQPLFDGKKEDALIAETFVRYLDTKDEDWPLLFPMVKSLVKAMDALQAFAKQEWTHDVTGFVVCGASKRGWTTWLTGATDKRVKAIAPMVIDTLNFPAQLPHQVASYGTYSDMIRDYTQRGLVPLPNTDAARKLWMMTDPYSFRDALTMPKFILNGANDPYWTADALNHYWDGLKGEKWVCYVPNAGHNLEQKLADGKVDRSRAIDGLAVFGRAQIQGKTLPKIEWTHGDADGKPQVSVRCTVAPSATRVWSVDSQTRDFRKQTWIERPATQKGESVTATVDPPASGYRAFFAEMDYDVDGLPLRLSTQMRVLGK